MSFYYCHSPSIFAQLRSNWLQMSEWGIQKTPDWITRLAAAFGLAWAANAKIVRRRVMTKKGNEKLLFLKLIQWSLKQSLEFTATAKRGEDLI